MLPRRSLPPGVERMTAFPFAHAGVGADGPVTSWTGWRDLVAHCLDQLDTPANANSVGLLYVTEPLAADLPDIEAFLAAGTGVSVWRGAVAPAICATGIEYFDVPAMAMMVLDVAEGAVSAFPGEPSSSDLQVASQALLAVVYADPRVPAVLDAMPGLAESTGAYLVGGLTSGSAPAPLVGVREAPSGISGVLLTEAVPVATGLTQGCSPIGPVHTVTAAEDGVIEELDGEPALDILKVDVGELMARDMRRIAGQVHAAIPVSGSDRADYLVRNLVGFDPEDGRVAIAEEMVPGDRVMFVRRDPAAAIEDMARMLDDVKRRASGRIRGALYHSCVARGPNQFGPGARELSMIAEAFGDIPVVGFFGNGEISHDRMYAYTGVLTVFPEPD